jgi:hypothetical protein
MDHGPTSLCTSQVGKGRYGGFVPGEFSQAEQNRLRGADASKGIYAEKVNAFTARCLTIRSLVVQFLGY